MVVYLVDASVAVQFYRPRGTFDNVQEYNASKKIKAHITKQKVTNQAILFLPAFCVAEVKNTLAKWHYRHKGVFKDTQHYKSVLGGFISHVHNRAFFYCYDLTRYHNLNVESILPVEHRTQTEFTMSALPAGTGKATVKAQLNAKGLSTNFSRYYLSSLDILIIAMGIELKKIYQHEVYLLTGDKRLALISKQSPEFPKPLYWHDLIPQRLPKA